MDLLLVADKNDYAGRMISSSLKIFLQAMNHISILLVTKKFSWGLTKNSRVNLLRERGETSIVKNCISELFLELGRNLILKREKPASAAI